MVNPVILCRQHLLGEHGELHKHRHNFVKRHRMTGRIAANACEPSAMEKRHDELAAEMLRRGGRHESPFTQPDISYLPQDEREHRVDPDANLQLLLDRCPECRQRHQQLTQ